MKIKSCRLMLIVVLGLSSAVSVFCADTTFPFYFSPAARVEIDGSLSDWPMTLPIILDSDSQVKRGTRVNYEDSNALIYCFFDADNLYLGAVVTDSSPLLNKNDGTNIWQADGIEGYIGFFRDQKKSSYGAADFQFGITLTPDSQKTFCWQKNSPLKDVKSAVVKKDKGCVLEARIPLANFRLKKKMAAGEPMWFDFALNNSATGSGRDSQLVYWGDGEGWADPGVWRKAVIVGTTKEIMAAQFITRLSIPPKAKHSLYYYVNGKPWVGDLTIGGKAYATAANGRIIFTADEEKILPVVLTVGGKKVNEELRVEVDRSKELVALPVKKIKVNQIGFHTREKKLFMMTVDESAAAPKNFEIINLTNDEVAFKGTLTEPVKDPATNENVVTGDFSAFRIPGKYVIKVEGVGESYEFRIANTVFSEIFHTTMRTYYLQRCGMKVVDAASTLEYGPCHTKDAYLKEDEKTFIQTTGGWHDAGDYGKYMPTAAITTAELLLLYELNPDGFAGFSLDIPESKNDVPDILDEVKYELDWMLKMQDKEGGVSHKVNTKIFPRTIAPEDDAEEITGERRYVYDRGTTDTGMFCGAVAIASRIYSKIDPEYAVKLREAAVKAGEFILALNAEGKILSPMNDSTGAYMSGEMNDEQLWALAELFRLTGDEKYLDGVRTHFRFKRVPAPSWDNPQTLGMLALLEADKTPKDLRDEIIKLINTEAERIVKKSKANAYRQSLYNNEYAWASNKLVLANGMILILAQKYATDSRDYLEVARRQLDYVLGANVLSKCFLTGMGSDPVNYPHHRVVQAKGIMIPGLLMGGPNNNAECGKYPKKLGPRGYVDTWEAYSCNEYAIDYNAPIVFLSGYFMNLEDKSVLK